MPDITDQILKENEPYYPPSVEDLLIYEEELLYEGNNVPLDWATNEIQQHTLNWVRVGLVAGVVRRYRLYRPMFKRWQDYCQQMLGKSTWQISGNIYSSLALERAKQIQEMADREVSIEQILRVMDTF